MNLFGNEQKKSNASCIAENEDFFHNIRETPHDTCAIPLSVEIVDWDD